MSTVLLLGDDLFKEVSSHTGIDGKRNIKKYHNIRKR